LKSFGRISEPELTRARRAGEAGAGAGCAEAEHRRAEADGDVRTRTRAEHGLLWQSKQVSQKAGFGMGLE
jgi:hypothetical protein